MTIANDLIFLGLRMSHVCGVGQTPLAEDVNDSLKLLNQMIGLWNLQRRNQANPNTLPTFPDLYADIGFWTPYEAVLLINLARAMRLAWAMPADKELDAAGIEALQMFQSINQQQFAPVHSGVPTTCQQVIFLALRMAGRLNDQQSVADASKDVDDAFSLLVMMLSQWQRRRWLVPALTELTIVSDGSEYYTIGPVRPTIIDAAFARLLNSPTSVDFPLAIIASREDYSAITLKSLSTFPQSVWLDTAWPTGRVYVWPIPPAGQYELHFIVAEALPEYSQLSDNIGLPPEYLDPIVCSLACRIVIASGGQPNPALLAQTRAALNTLRMANAQFSEAALPAIISPMRGSSVSAAGSTGFQSGFMT